MGAVHTLIWFAAAATHEVALFAAAMLLIGGLDDLAVDLIWIARTAWRRLIVYRHRAPTTVESLPAPIASGRIAVFVPAWREAEVIEPMLKVALGRFRHDDFRIFVGVYPNDPDTIRAVRAAAASDPRVRIAINPRPGPTTKADNLNAMWAALRSDEDAGERPYKAIVLHDAEDVVHPSELQLFDLMVERFDLVQLPVIPLVDQTSRLISGHYADEFAESHNAGLVVREFVGAGMPSAGVGCALSRRAVEGLSDMAGGLPFAADSLTEDYEMGLRLGESGWRGIFLRIATHPGGPPVAVRAYFPGEAEAAIRQKTRWITGIALHGWDRLGWRGHLGDLWMRLRDRRPPLAALVILAAYTALLMWIATAAVQWATGAAVPEAPAVLGDLFLVNLALMLWRAGMRFVMVARIYGGVEGARALVRILIANFILLAAARRAAVQYIRIRHSGRVAWDKTSHRFPEALPAE